MSDNTTLEYQSDGTKILPGNSWGSLYTDDATQIANFHAIRKEIQEKLAKGEPVYVQIKDDRRKGSIGRLESIDFHYNSHAASYGSYRNYTTIYVNDIKVVWDERKNYCHPHCGEIEYLPDWTGGTVWAWTPGLAEKPPRIIPYDTLGQEIEPGQFVCFVHRRYGNITMQFGTVTRLTDKGGVFVKKLKLKDGETGGQELKAFDANELVIVNDTLMSRLLLAKLSAD